MVCENGKNLSISEIKSSVTFNKDYIKNIELFIKEYEDYDIKSKVVYAGGESFAFRGIDVINYCNFPFAG